jgi:hypothetical protein
MWLPCTCIETALSSGCAVLRFTLHFTVFMTLIFGNVNGVDGLRRTFNVIAFVYIELFSMELSPCWEVANRLATLEFLSIFWDREVHYSFARVLPGPYSDPILPFNYAIRFHLSSKYCGLLRSKRFSSPMDIAVTGVSRTVGITIYGM